MWVIKSVSRESDTYTIRNMVGGTYMSLTGSATNGTAIVGSQQAGDNQKWIIKKGTRSDMTYSRIQNKGNRSFIDLAGGAGANGTKVLGWQSTWDDSNTNQRWNFSSQSLTSAEVRTALDANPYLRSDFKSFVSDGMYLILSQARYQEIWRNSGLQSRRWREEVFDCDDFSFVYKGEVGKWGDSQFKATGFGILCGIMFGSSKQGAHAYNWMVKSGNHANIEFFEPQDNTFKDDPGYSAYFGVY
ncbi:carbohydrate-binding module family 13 protein [Peniophora sp. CONT]|nr:carbohydrate-binding module family 13 protein [Peniophora sp. CONT]